MATSLANTTVPFIARQSHRHIYNKPRLKYSFSARNSQYRSLITGRKPTSCKVLTKTNTNGYLAPANKVFELKNEEEKEEDDIIIEEEHKEHLANRWSEIHGGDDWEGMLDPMDSLLRSELIRYGEFAQACYDAFDHDSYSKYCGSCLYTPRNFFKSLGMTGFGYSVTRYLYATTHAPGLSNFFKKSKWGKVWSENSNWMGYVAVSNDETSKHLGRRDITIAWRGTVTKLEWVADLKDILRPIQPYNIPSPDPTVKVQAGFLGVYTDKDENCPYGQYSAREQIVTEIQRLTKMYSNENLSITVTGHSMGAALAILSAYDIAETGLNLLDDGRAIPVCVYSFSGPRVGNSRFKERLEVVGVKVLRVVNVHDVVPMAPGFLVNEHSALLIRKYMPLFIRKLIEWLPWSYSHVGEELALDHKHSPFLNDTWDPTDSHNLEVHLHLLDGYHGKNKTFELASKRDHALVNKASNFLKEEHLVPPNWRQDANKGMARNKEGRWIQPDRLKLGDHHHKKHGLNGDHH
ncbi:hypothetical protein GIB67_027130 [Kingdonia uniflora]|uniref:Fungal lipase-type domain-containing protein n=1 Tax=Kingdonia uniflora TaxID=39325 RepID=A0A7J7P1X3_9MAGN|nr:hypothetical protein GIB67_027130 [Kingdonia uniflora]